MKMGNMEVNIMSASYIYRVRQRNILGFFFDGNYYIVVYVIGYIKNWFFLGKVINLFIMFRIVIINLQMYS